MRRGTLEYVMLDTWRERGIGKIKKGKLEYVRITGLLEGKNDGWLVVGVNASIKLEC